MTLSISDSKNGAVIKGEAQFGQILLVNYEEAYNLVHRDINKIQEWAPALTSCSILDNRFEAWEVGARRRVVIKKSPYTDTVIREVLTEKAKTASRAFAKFTYSPLDGEARSFAALRLDSAQKRAKAMAQKGPLVDPEAPNVSESMHYGSHNKNGNANSNTNKYASDTVTDEPIATRSGACGTAFAPHSGNGSSAASTPTTAGAPNASTRAKGDGEEEGEEAPTLLAFTTTYSFHALSGGIATTGKAPQIGAAAGELRCYMEVRVDYSLSCETPGEHDERLLYDHRVLRDFLDKFWVREISEAFSNYAHAQAYHLTDGYDPLRGPTAGYGAINLVSGTYRGVAPSPASTGASSTRPPVLGGPSDARVAAVADAVGLRFAEEQAKYDAAVSQLAAKAKTPAEDEAADTMLRLLSSWERVTAELKRSQEMVERLSHELDAARLITNAATGLSSAQERGRVLYDYEEAKKL